MPNFYASKGINYTSNQLCGKTTIIWQGGKKASAHLECGESSSFSI
jgi:hypothetical protein